MSWIFLVLPVHLLAAEAWVFFEILWKHLNGENRRSLTLRETSGSISSRRQWRRKTPETVSPTGFRQQALNRVLQASLSSTSTVGPNVTSLVMIICVIIGMILEGSSWISSPNIGHVLLTNIFCHHLQLLANRVPDGSTLRSAVSNKLKVEVSCAELVCAAHVYWCS